MAVLPEIVKELHRFASPAVTPQALAWHDKLLWIGSRDGRRIYAIEPTRQTIVHETDAPGIPWAAVSDGKALWFTLGEGAEDDRYLRRFVPGSGFSEEPHIACPDLTGSYLSFDGEFLYLSQWYKHRILKLDGSGNILRVIDAGAEICGHTFIDGDIYVLRGTEQGDEDWRIARITLGAATEVIEDLARVPFQCRSLGWDGKHFWSNHRSHGETVCFQLPV